MFLVAGHVLYWLLGMAHPGMVILGLGFGVVSKALAQLTDQATALQEQCVWRI